MRTLLLVHLSPPQSSLAGHNFTNFLILILLLLAVACSVGEARFRASQIKNAVLLEVGSVAHEKYMAAALAGPPLPDIQDIGDYNVHLYFNEENNEDMVGWFLHKLLAMPDGTSAFFIGYIGPAPGRQESDFPMEMHVEWVKCFFNTLVAHKNPAGLCAAYASHPYQVLKQAVKRVSTDHMVWSKTVVAQDEVCRELKGVELRIAHYRPPTFVDSADLERDSPMSLAYHQLLLAAEPSSSLLTPSSSSNSSNSSYSESCDRAHLYVTWDGSIAAWARYKALPLGGGKSCHRLLHASILSSEKIIQSSVSATQKALEDLLAHLFDYLAAHAVVVQQQSRVMKQLGLAAAPDSPEMVLLENLGGQGANWQLAKMQTTNDNDEEVQGEFVSAGELAANRQPQLAVEYAKLVTRDRILGDFRPHLYVWPAGRILGLALYDDSDEMNTSKGVPTYHLVHVCQVPDRKEFPALFSEEKQVELVINLFEHLRHVDLPHAGLSAAHESREHELLKLAAERMAAWQGVLVGDHFKEELDEEGKLVKKTPQMHILLYQRMQ